MHDNRHRYRKGAKAKMRKQHDQPPGVVSLRWDGLCAVQCARTIKRCWATAYRQGALHTGDAPVFDEQRP